MPRVVSVANAFSSGELSDSAYGRTDIQKYANGMSCIRNYLVHPLGGLIRRPGTRFVCETKLSQFKARVLPFEFSVAQAYLLELGCQYLRVYRNNAIISSTPEQVTNGTFNADINGWTTVATLGNSVAWSGAGGGIMVLTDVGAGGNLSARQDVTVGAGVAQTVAFQLQGSLFLNINVSIGSTSGGTDLLATTLAPGSYVYTVTSPTTTLSIKFGAAGSGNTYNVDNVSVTPTGSTPFEVSIPYDHNQLAAIDTVQSADEMYFLHQCHAVRKLSRYGDTCWKFNCVTFTPPPTIEFGARPATEVQAGALSGANVTFTAFNGPTFLAADVGREIQITAGVNAGARAGIKTVSSSLVAVANICVPWIDTSVTCHGNWKLSGSPKCGVTLSDHDSVGKSITATTDAAAWRGSTFVTDTDCGKYAVINGGQMEITCVTSTTVARGVLRGVASSKTKAESGAWSLEEALWSCIRGYPQTGDFHEDRLYLDAGFRFCGSKSGDYENFGLGTLDDDAIVFASNAKTLNTIRAIVGGADLQIFTAGTENIASGGADSPITPSNIRLKTQTVYGAGGVPPIRAADNVTLFVTRSGKQLREFTVPADSISGDYKAPDLLLLAGHLTEDASIVDLAYQREPYSVIWAVRSDGVLLSCTYRREENVVAWAAHDTCGFFESVACIPHPDGDRDQVWCIVRRTINGQTKRFVEYFDDSPLTYDRRLTDCSVVYTCGTATTVFGGLGHLECERVRALADGIDRGYFTVVGAQITLPVAANKVEIGQGYTSEAITLRPEISFGGQSIQPMKKRWARVWGRTKDSCGMSIRTTGGTYEPIKGMDGTTIYDFDVPRLGDWTDARLHIRQDKPLPSHLLMIGGVLDVGDK